jgi:hypothetical protein
MSFIIYKYTVFIKMPHPYAPISNGGGKISVHLIFIISQFFSQIYFVTNVFSILVSCCCFIFNLIVINIPKNLYYVHRKVSKKGNWYIFFLTLQKKKNYRRNSRKLWLKSPFRKEYNLCCFFFHLHRFLIFLLKF